jgi:sulfonate transport system ATP-binding protein
MFQINALTKVYPNGTHALENFSLSVTEGEVVAIIGGSGCGKSTLLRLIAGLETPSRGEVKLHNRVVREPDALVNIVFQEPRLFPWLTVADNIAFGIQHLGANERREKTEAALRKIGLHGYDKKWVKELSGGQAQRVALARALVTSPEILLLDEPFSALDALTRTDLQDHLTELWTDNKTTMLLVTHDIEEAAFLADRIIVMKPWPGRVFHEVAVDLPRKRDRNSIAFVELKRHLNVLLEQSLQDSRQAYALA